MLFLGRDNTSKALVFFFQTALQSKIAAPFLNALVDMVVNQTIAKIVNVQFAKVEF